MIQTANYFRPKSPMLYADTTTVAQGDNVCPRCNGAVFQVFLSHFKCF